MDFILLCFRRRPRRRISLTQGAGGRAGLYGLVLAGLTWIGMQIYVDYPKDSAAASFSWLINLGLVGVVWWCSDRLTRDCTQIDEETEVGGEGLLQATGPGKAGQERGRGESGRDGNATKRSPGWLIGWWERYERFREKRKKQRVLGAWVIYFSLAALPLFGLGEALIPAGRDGPAAVRLLADGSIRRQRPRLAVDDLLPELAPLSSPTPCCGCRPR